MNNYYKEMDLKYVEKAICLEKFYIHEPGILKFYVPAILPLEGNRTEPYTLNVGVSKGHLVNMDTSKIACSGNCQISNYIEMELYNFITAPIRDIIIDSVCVDGKITHTITRLYFYEVDEDDMVDKLKEFIMAFVGGDYNHKKILGRYS